MNLSNPPKTSDAVASHVRTHPLPGQVVLVLQGGGALGAYQMGVFRALHESGIEPDWVIGTSIGAINASLIAGNKHEDRLDRMEEFWSRVGHTPAKDLLAASPFGGMAVANLMTLATGVESFFAPNPMALLGPYAPLGPEKAGYYSVAPLRELLSELVDFDHLNTGPTRLTVGAANVQTAQMRYFDSRDEDLDLRHVLASGALPPAFPAVRIGEELYWDGGVLSNTPVEAVFDDSPRKNSVIFMVNLWSPDGAEPDTLWQVMTRQKDIQYSSRAMNQIERQRQLHYLRHIIKELAMKLPEDERGKDAVKELEAQGCLTHMHLVRLLAPNLGGQDNMKDIDFSAAGIRRRSAAGYEDTVRVLTRKPWEDPFDPLEGFILHDSVLA
ncbi:patatin-like phospholipase family protein [Seohaeicola nanhaiensis]|uniref:Patatin-like phospholipase family protein n=1 Tax=Seohaeicola nanhaiensis TaxID=1387282 RepID=A0ABV9KDH8_9RHOB